MHSNSKSFLMAALLFAGVLQLWAEPAQARHRETTDFAFVVVDRQVGGSDLLILNGNGTISSDDIEGGGSFTHFRPGGRPPFPVVASGTWEATRLISFTPIGTYGAHAAGILEMQVRLIPSGGSPVPATMRMVCNIGAGGLQTGEGEGVTLRVRSGSVFEPMDAGVTVFSLGAEDGDEQ